MYQYENTYIGTFVYTFGYLAGKRGESNTASFSIFQQTPKDPVLGDLFTNWKGKNFLFEFKRHEKLILNELKKEKKRNLIQLLNNPDLKRRQEMADKGHFLCYPKEDSFEIISYRSIRNRKRKCYPFSMFVNLILEGNERIGLNHEELKSYLDFVNSILNESNTTSDVSGVLVNVSKDNEIHFVEYTNSMTLKKEMSYNLSMEKEIIENDFNIDNSGPKM